MLAPAFVHRARLDAAVEHGPAHLRPMYLAVRDHGVSFAVVTQRAGRFAFPSDKPVVALLGDDLDEALGPAGFHLKSVRRFVASCEGAVIIACDPQPRLYIAAATVAVMLRRNAVIIETRSEHEADWVDLIRSIKPDIRMLLGTVRPPTEAQH